MKIKFQRPGKIRMTRPWRGQSFARVLSPIHILNRQRFLPIGPVAILDAYRDRSADRSPVPDSGQHIRPIFLDALPPPPSPPRPPAPLRPNLSWRRANSGSTNARSTGTPAGKPDIQVTSACPCD